MEVTNNTLLGHINIVVDDLIATRDFFVNNFGFTAGESTLLEGEWVDNLTGQKGVKAQYIPVSQEGSTTRIELLCFDHPDSPVYDKRGYPMALGYRHIGFHVDNIETMVAQLKLQPEVERFLSPVQTVTAMGVKTVYFIGPDGVLMQLTETIKS